MPEDEIKTETADVSYMPDIDVSLLSPEDDTFHDDHSIKSEPLFDAEEPILPKIEMFEDHDSSSQSSVEAEAEAETEVKQKTKAPSRAKPYSEVRETKRIQDVKISSFMQMSCELCDIKYPSFSDVYVHYDRIHKIRGYVRCCQRKFYSRGILLQHIDTHLNPDAHKCDTCGKNFCNKLTLRNHIIVVHGPEDKKTHVCDKCGKGFVKPHLLVRHVRERHPTEEDKKYICDDCGCR